MAMRKIPLEEAMNLPLGFSISDADLEAGLSGIEPSLKEHGWKGHEAQPADSNADKEPDEAGSVLKEEG